MKRILSLLSAQTLALSIGIALGAILGFIGAMLNSPFFTKMGLVVWVVSPPLLLVFICVCGRHAVRGQSPVNRIKLFGMLGAGIGGLVGFLLGLVYMTMIMIAVWSV